MSFFLLRNSFSFFQPFNSVKCTQLRIRRDLFDLAQERGEESALPSLGKRLPRDR